MKLELEFELKESTFDREYRKIFISYLKHVLSGIYDGKYFDMYFEGTNPKDYTFSVIFPQPVFGKDAIELKSTRIKMLFSASNRGKTGFIFFQGFINQKHKEFPLPNGNTMKLVSIKERKEQTIERGKVIFRVASGSGLCIRKHVRETNKDQYFVFSDSEFQEEAQFVLCQQAIRAGFRQQQAEAIRIKPISGKKVVALHYGIYVDISLGMFQLEATPEILQYFYEAGIGGRHSAGFGMVEVVTQDVI